MAGDYRDILDLDEAADALHAAWFVRHGPGEAWQPVPAYLALGWRDAMEKRPANCIDGAGVMRVERRREGR